MIPNPRIAAAKAGLNRSNNKAVGTNKPVTANVFTGEIVSPLKPVPAQPDLLDYSTNPPVYHTKYDSPYKRETQENPDYRNYLLVSPLIMQELVLELIRRHYQNNDPEKSGFVFEQKYSEDPNESQILIDLSYNFNGKEAGKKPAIFVTRGDVTFNTPTINAGMVGKNVAESETQRQVVSNMNIGVSCLATNVGFTEQLADFTRSILMAFQQDIQKEFCLMRFRVVNQSAPQIYPQAKDNFFVTLSINLVYSEGLLIKKDDLKLKKVGRYLFANVKDAGYGQPVLSQ